MLADGMPLSLQTSCLIAISFTQIQSAQSELGCQIVSVVTDGAGNMSACRDRLQEKNPQLMTYWCQAHLLNLVVGDFMKHTGRSQTLQAVVNTLKCFRSHDNLSAELHLRQLGRPPLPCNRDSFRPPPIFTPFMPGQKESRPRHPLVQCPRQRPLLQQAVGPSAAGGCKMRQIP